MRCIIGRSYNNTQLSTLWPMSRNPNWGYWYQKATWLYHNSSFCCHSCYSDYCSHYFYSLPKNKSKEEKRKGKLSPKLTVSRTFTSYKFSGIPRNFRRSTTFNAEFRIQSFFLNQQIVWILKIFVFPWCCGCLLSHWKQFQFVFNIFVKVFYMNNWMLNYEFLTQPKKLCEVRFLPTFVIHM